MEEPPAIRRMSASTAGAGVWLAPALVGLGLATAALLYAFPPGQYALYPRCLFFQVTGLQCPGCGGLRAAHHLLHGEWAMAWRLNPLAVLVGPAAVLYGAAEWFRRRTGRDYLRACRGRGWIWATVAALVVFTIVRNLPAGS